MPAFLTGDDRTVLKVGLHIPNVLCFLVSVFSKYEYMNLSAVSKDLLHSMCVKILSGVLLSGHGLKEHILLHSSPLDLSACLW
jgi:hypothetical protein